MKNKKIKKIITPIILLVILGSLIAATVILKHFNSTEDDTAEDDSVIVLDKTGKTVTDLEFTFNGQTLAFTYENDTWIYSEDEHFPVDGTKLTAAASSFMKVSASATVDENSRGEDSEYGLDSPRVSASAAFSDGTRYTLTFGDTNPFNDCQYFTVTGDSNVYMAQTTLASTFTYELDSYFRQETFPLTSSGVTAEKTDSITITTAGGDENIISDEDGKDELLSLLKVLNLSSWEDYYADEAELRDSYGISDDGDRVCIKYTVSSTSTDEDGNTVNADVPAEYTIRLGRKYDVADNGENKESGYFYSPSGSSVVYSVSSETVDKIYNYLTYKPSGDTAES